MRQGQWNILVCYDHLPTHEYIVNDCQDIVLKNDDCLFRINKPQIFKETVVNDCEMDTQMLKKRIKPGYKV